MKRCSTTYVNREMQMKTVRYTHQKWPKLKTLTMLNAGEDTEQQDLSYNTSENIIWYSRGWLQTSILLISAFQVARIIDMSHHLLVVQPLLKTV
jgi:hypothetical protein